MKPARNAASTLLGFDAALPQVVETVLVAGIQHERRFVAFRGELEVMLHPERSRFMEERPKLQDVGLVLGARAILFGGIIGRLGDGRGLAAHAHKESTERENACERA